MRISIICPGTASDVYPFIALALRLADAGCEVSLATHRSFSHRVDGTRVRLVSLPGDPEKVMRDQTSHELGGHDETPLDTAARFAKNFLPFLADSLVACLPACKSADCIIGSPLGFFAYDVATALGCRYLMASLIPVTPTREFPMPMVASTLPFGSIGNLLTYNITDQIFWQMLRDPVNLWREEYLNLPRLGFMQDPLKRIEAAEVDFLYAFSQTVVPKPADWQDRHHVTGYWFDRNEGYRLPTELDVFLAGDAPVLAAGFGCMSYGRRLEVTEMLTAAVEAAGWKAVLLTGWGGLSESVSSGSIFTTRSLSLEHLFPKVKAVLHHCEAGLTGQALRYGIPSIPVPFVWDQHFWARRIHERGFAVKPIPIADLSFQAVTEALKQLEESPQLHRHCERVSRRISSEDGLAQAVRIITGEPASHQ